MNRSVIDITGERYGKYTVISFSHSSNRRSYWNCKCDCGAERVVLGKRLRNGDTKSCGCIRRDSPYHEDLTGRTFNRLTVISYAFTKDCRAWWNCICSCGASKAVTGHDLKSGNVKSCGCLNKEIRIENNHKKRTHNKSQTRLYRIWRCMKSRCYSPKSDSYPHYGGRGITICNEWLNDNTKFFKWAEENGYSDNLSIDRIDNNKGYFPDNCRWVDNYTQSNNKRTNKYYTYKGKTLTLSQWSRELGIKRKILNDRILHSKWSIEKAFTTPIRSRSNNKANVVCKEI